MLLSRLGPTCASFRSRSIHSSFQSLQTWPRQSGRLFIRSHYNVYTRRPSSLIRKRSLGVDDPQYHGCFSCVNVPLQQQHILRNQFVHHAEDYTPPSVGFLSYLPRSWVPFAELMRIDKPAGTLYLFFPCLFSTLLAAIYTGAPGLSVAWTSYLFLTGAMIMRGAGCTVNDLWDRNLDPQVARTRLRPIARGAVSPFAGVTFAGLQCLAGLGVLVQFPHVCLYYGIPSLLLVATYPLAKRITHYPQLVLGLTFSWGAILGFPALGFDLLSDSAALQAVGALYASCVSWTVLYDMIYAHMDIKDDAKAGIKSIALRHDKETKVVLSGLAATQTALLWMAGSALDLSPIYSVTTCSSAIVTLGIMIWRVKLKNPRDCWWWFKHGSWITGGGITGGMLAELLWS